MRHSQMVVHSKNIYGTFGPKIFLERENSQQGNCTTNKKQIVVVVTKNPDLEKLT